MTRGDKLTARQSGSKRKHLFRVASLLIFLGSIFFLINAAFQLDLKVILLDRGRAIGTWIGILSVAYTAFFIPLTLGWLRILRYLSDKAEQISFLELFGVRAKTNFFKYFPGSIMEFVGRNYIVNQYGVGHLEIALSSGLEIIFRVVASFLVAALFALSIFHSEVLWGAFNWGSIFWAGSIVGAVVAVLVGMVITKKIWRVAIPDLFTVRFLKNIPAVLLLNCLAIIWLGALMVFILVKVLGIPIQPQTSLYIIGIVSFSWVCGFMTPGVPGGLGVRDALLFVLLSPTVPQEPLMAAVILHRLMAIIGDVILFLGAFVWSPGLQDKRGMQNSCV